jgi:hypothetical protein
MGDEEQLGDRSSLPAIAAVAVVAVAGLYFALFGLLMLDDLVLGKIVYHHAPEWFIDAARFIYAPLIVVIKRLRR